MPSATRLPSGVQGVYVAGGHPGEAVRIHPPRPGVGAPVSGGPALVALTLFSSLALAFAGSATWGGTVFWFHDLAHQHYPWRAWAAREWARGDLPLWAPIGWGFPLLGDGQAGILYPPNLVLYALLSEPLAFNWSIVVHLVLAGMGGWALGRTIGCSAIASVLLGLVWSWSGLSISHVDYLGMFEVLAWFPWMVAGAVRAARGEPGRAGVAGARFIWRPWIATGLATGMAWLAGHPQAALIATYASVVAALWTGRRRWGGTVAGLAIQALVAVGLAAPQLVASAELAQLGVRAGGVDSEFAEVGALPPEELVNIVLPQAFGRDRPADMEIVSAHRRSYQGRGVAWWEDCFFVGAPVLILVLAAGRQVPLWGAGLAGLLWMLGTPVYDLVRLLPGMEWFRFPVRASMIVVLVTAVLAARGLDRWSVRPPGRAPRRIAITVGALLVMAAAATAVLRFAHDPLVAGIGARLTRTVTPEDVAVATSRGLPPPTGRTPEQALERARSLVAELEADLAPHSPRVAGPAAMLLLLAGALTLRRGRPLAVLGVVALDLVTTGWPLVQRASVDVLKPPPAAAALDEGARVGILGRRVASTLDGQMLSANLGLLWGAEDVIVPSPLRTNRSERMAWLLGLDLTDEPVPEKAARLSRNRRWLDAAGVEVITTTMPLDLAGFEPVAGSRSEHPADNPARGLPDGRPAVPEGADYTGPVHVYRNPLAGDPAFLVGCTLAASGPEEAERAMVGAGASSLGGVDPYSVAVVEGEGLDLCVAGPAGTVVTTQEGSARWTMDVHATRAAWLVLIQAMAPGQRWTVDGVPVEAAPTDLAFQGIAVPPGRHEVVFEVRGGRVRAALGLSVLTALGALGALAWRRAS